MVEGFYGSLLLLPLVDKRLPVAANGAAQGAIWPFDREVPPDRQLVVAHDIYITMDIGGAPVIRGDYPYRDGKPARVKRCTCHRLVLHGHRASVERQQLLQALGLYIYPLRGDGYSDDSLGLIYRVGARTTDPSSRVVYPHTVEPRDFVRQCDGCAANPLSERPHLAAHQDGDNE